jgi:hypothetical protein
VDFVVLPDCHIMLGAWKARYDFGENRVATLALLTITTLPGRRSCGTATAKFSGHAFTFRSSPTVFAETRMSGSACTRILSGKPPRAIWRAATLLGLYFIWASSLTDIFLPKIMAVAAVAVVVAAAVVWAWGAAPP